MSGCCHPTVQFAFYEHENKLAMQQLSLLKH
jgi:hypothetical protein